ncbi:MAG: methyltransferase domain-containing protein [Methanobacterium sp.]|nr:methyltransferase domain-containing protein [Methanobacterium sp.]
MDQERLAGFYEAIRNVNGIIFDIGAGSGILTAFAVPYADIIYSVELDSNISQKTQVFLSGFKNVTFIEADAYQVEFPQKADYIICEMLDTALIDEEQVPVLNSIIKYLKKKGKVIPKGIINGIEPIYTEIEHIIYQENSNTLSKTLGPLNIYSKYDFRNRIEPQADFNLKLMISQDGIFNGIKITTFTLITSNIICGPTPMLNPPLIIPTEKLEVKRGDIVKLNLSYLMGGGLYTIRTEINGISSKKG